MVEFAHSQNQYLGIQLTHAGRKASTLTPFLAPNDEATPEQGGWPNNVKGPSDIPFSPQLCQPKAMTKADIEKFKAAWVAAVKRAVKAGVDFIEIHNAHGYLLFKFLSPVSNSRTDEYGGSFENRIRLTNEIISLSRQNMPKDMPLLLRVSATEWLEKSRPDLPSWKSEDTVQLARVVVEKGEVDLFDISSGGNHPDQKIISGSCFQAPFSRAVKEAVGSRLLVSVVGSINDGKAANDLLNEGARLCFHRKGIPEEPGTHVVGCRGFGR